MSSYIESIFDETNPDEKLWKTAEKLKIQLSKQKPTFSQEGYKLSSTSNHLEKRLFLLLGKHICYKKTGSKEIGGCMDLTWSRAEFHKVKEPELKPFFKYYVMLIKNCKFVRVYIHGDFEKTVWRRGLRRKCAMTDFHDRYEIGKLIGQGSYGRVKNSNLTIY